MKDKLCALHIGKYFPPYAGGMETFLRDLIASMARRGVRSGALVHRSDLSLFSTEESFRVEQRELPVTRAAVWLRLLFTPISPAFPLLLHRMIKRHSPDILHFHMPNVSAFWALFLPSARRLPWVIHWHSDVPVSSHKLGLRLFYQLYKPFEQAMLEQADTVIATSPPYLESSEPLASFRYKCAVVPLGLDPKNLPVGVCTVPKNGDHRLRVLAIGRLTYYKGFEYMIRAASMTEDAVFHLVGSGELENSLKRLAADLGVLDRVTFHGKVPAEQLAEQYARCDCVCLPSIERTEAFGLVLLEAMYFGKATVISDVPGSGMGWIVDDGTTGLKVPMANPGALAAAFRHLRADRDNLARLGANGRSEFDRQFDICQSSDAIADIYTELLHAK